MPECRVKDFCYTWTVESFFSSIEFIPEFRSPKIHVSAADRIAFYLNCDGNHAFHIGVEKSEELELALVSCQVTCRSASFSPKTCTDGTTGWSFQWKSTSRETTPSNDCLKVVIHLFLRESLPFWGPEQNSISLLKLVKDMTFLLDSGKYSDLKLVAGGQEFCVHKAVLAARAPELVEMLELTQGSSRKEVNCIRPQVLKKLLRYFYTGTFEHTSGISDSPLGLSATLDALKMDALKSKLYAYPNRTEVTTRLATASHGFVWPVRDFGALLPGQVVASPIVHPDKHCELRLQLKKEASREEDEEVQVSLSLAADSNRQGCNLRFDIGLEDVFGDRVLVRSWEAEVEEWIPALTINPTTDLLPPDDTLHLYCRVTARRVESEVASSESSASSLQDCCSGVSDPQTLSSDLEHLLKSPRFHDLTVCAKGQTFRVHKAILAARAPKLLDAILDVLPHNLPDIEPDVLEKLLGYIYSGNSVQSDCASATKLYLTAYKYELSPLKVTCLSYIKSSITF